MRLAALLASVALSACGYAGPAQAQGSPELDAQLDAALARGIKRTGAPGATGAVVEDGELLWAGGAGIARRWSGGAMEPNDLFPIASTTKTVAAAIAMALAEAGRLRLDRPIHAALPSLPGSGRITPRMLMNHSSGLSDYFGDGEVAAIARRHPYHVWTRAEVLSHVRRLKFRPGTRHDYSNSGYIALGGVVEDASGKSVEQLFQRIVAMPLGLERSTFRYGAARQGEFAHPLRAGRGGRFRDRFGAHAMVPTDYWGKTWTDGGLATTAPELARIGNALYAGDLLSPASVAAMLPPEPGGWGLGTFDKRALDRTWIGHDGLYGGYQTENWTDRERGITVVVMTNAAGLGTVSPRIWREVAAAGLEP